MNKRKRDIFTVAESVPNWFTASDQSTRPIEADTRTIDVTKTLGDSLTYTASGEKAASSSKDQISPRLGLEHGPELANWPESVIGPLSQPRVEEWTSPDTPTGYQAVAKVEGFTVAEDMPTQAGIDGGTSRGSHEDIEGGDDLWISQGTDVAEDGGVSAQSHHPYVRPSPDGNFSINT